MALDDTCLVVASDTSIQVFKREQLEEQSLIINTHSFSCKEIALSTSFIIASEDTRECSREIRVWNKLDGGILTTFCINKCVEILNIRCGANDILITEYHTYAPKPSMFTYQVKFFTLENKNLFLFGSVKEPKESLCLSVRPAQSALKH